MTTAQHLIEDAHREAAGRSGKELSLELQEILGQKVVAFALGDRHPKSIGRYARGEREPEPAALRGLVDLYTVVEILLGGMRRETIRSWMLGTNPRLKGQAPVEAFHEGRAYDVMRAAQAFVSPR